MISQLHQVWIIFASLLWLMASLAIGTAMNGAVPDEQRLYRDLMWGYESSVRPVVNATQTIHIDFSISINQIVDLDERKQVLTTNVFIDQEWVDENLKWNSTEYNGIRTLRVPATQVWLPDTFVFNNADDGSTGFMHGVYVLLNANGTVLWPVPVKLKSSCKVDIAYFPFDDQMCILRFGSWIYSGEWLTFSSSLAALDLGNYMDNSEWELIAVFYEQSERTYACCPEAHPDLSFILHVRRRTFYYIFNIIVPCIMLSVLTLLTFWIPMTSGEKVSLGLSVFLAFSMFMLLIAEEVPATSESVPLIGIYLTTVMTMTSVSVIMAVMVINLYERGSKARRPPHWVKVVVLRWICTVLRMKHDIERLAHSIRLDEEEEKRYYCPLHSTKNDPSSRRSSYLSPRGLRKVGSNQVSPDNRASSPEGEVGELSKRFGIIEQESSRRHCGGVVNAAMSPQGAPQSSDEEAGEDEPIWQRRENIEPNRNQSSPPPQCFNQSNQLELPRQNIQVHRSNVSNQNGANYRRDGLFGVKFTRVGPEPPEETNPRRKPENFAEQQHRTRQESHYKQKQDSLADLVIQVCRREKALLNRKEIVVEWQTIATVIDRLLFWVFLTATLVCYIIILFVIPSTKPILKEIKDLTTDQVRILRRT